MKRKAATILIAAFVMFPVSGGTAEDGEIERRRTRIFEVGDDFADHEAFFGLDALVRRLLRNNPGLESLFEDFRAELEKSSGAGSLPDPNFTYFGFIEKLQTRTGPQKSRWMIKQTFPWAGTLKWRSETARIRAEIRWLEVLWHRAKLVGEFKKAYFRYAFLGREIRIFENTLQLLKGLEPVIQSFYQGGGGQKDLLRLQVEIATVENELESRRLKRPVLSRRLRSLLNEPEAESPLEWPPLPEPGIADPGEGSYAVFSGRLEQANPELRVFEERIRLERARVREARFEGYPRWGLGLGYFDTGETGIPGVAGSGDDPYGVEISMSLPVWRGKYRALVREMRFREAAENRRYEEARNRLLSRWEQALFSEEDALRRIALFRDSLVPRARQSLEITEAAYRTGEASFLEWIDSERKLLELQRKLLEESAKYYQARAELETLTGGMTP